MIVRIHGFDWQVYIQQVMPALNNWLIERDENPLYQMYQLTRCAREEQCVPAPLQSLCTWPRARAYVKQLLDSPHARREYAHLCSPEQFTATSDRYIYRHPPQLLRPSEALATVWGALIETYCLPWFSLFKKAQEHPAYQLGHELTRLLDQTEARTLAAEAQEQEAIYAASEMEQDVEDVSVGPIGVMIGRLPATLQIRGWLATIAVRAMVLFELLACERRCVPFGYQPGTPFASYSGYLTPEEVLLLSLCLRDVHPPHQALAVIDYQRFRQRADTTFRTLDEVLPLHADTFLSTVHLAAQQGIGLICSIG
jgi:hypothetical protein